MVSAPRAPGFPHRAHGKESVCNAGEPASIPGWGRSPGEGNGNPLQYSCLEIPLGRGAWWVTVHGVARVGHDLMTKPPNHHHPEHPVLPLYQIEVIANVFSKIRVTTHQYDERWLSGHILCVQPDSSGELNCPTVSLFCLCVKLKS